MELEQYTRASLDCDDCGASAAVRRATWDRLRYLCRELACEIPTLAQVQQMEQLMNLDRNVKIPRETQLFCESLDTGKLVCLDLDVGCLTGESIYYVEPDNFGKGAALGIENGV